MTLRSAVRTWLREPMNARWTMSETLRPPGRDSSKSESRSRSNKVCGTMGGSGPISEGVSGGRVWMESLNSVPGGNWIVIATDPQGAAFGVVGPKGN